MASLALACPLCCNETFSSHSSLKYHILSIIDNLLCPSCNERCTDFVDMADHLGSKCKNLVKPNINEIEINELVPENVGKERSFDDSKEEREEIDCGNFQIKVEEPEETSECNIKGNKESNGEDNEMMYSCQMCNTTFNSVQEHLEKYHEGEEVLLETDQDDLADSQGDGVLEYQGITDDDTEDDIFDSERTVLESTDSTADVSERSSIKSRTIAEEEVVDKNGLKYTRKIVQDSSYQYVNQDPQIIPKITKTTKYIVEEGKVRQITEEQAANITDKSSIIEVHSCPNCNLQFPNISHFNKHNCNAKQVVGKTRDRKNQLLKIKEELRYQCTFCLAIYTSLIALNDHMKSHLIQDQTGLVQKKTITMSLHICEICNTKFPTYKQLRLHSRMHDPVKDKKVEPPVSYNIMGQSNDDNEEFANSERETFQCPVCDKLYDKEYEEVHMKSHENNKKIVCLVCNRQFESKSNLEMHMKAHSNTKKFACSYCKKPFNSYEALEVHVINQCQKRQYECQYCGRRFSRPHEKVKHERIHTGEKPHVCQLCGRAFRVSYCLTLHMRTHTNSRPYTCQDCGKRFKSHSVFNHHMQTHSEERNYKCPFCPKAFKTAVQLAGHKNSHTKPFACKECNRPFASLYAVKAHMETHKRENNLKFDCWICGASYARSFALRDHMVIHGENAVRDKERNDLIKIENITDDNHSASEDQPMESEEHQILSEEVYQITNNGDAVCHVLANVEEGNTEAYVVNLQEAENDEDAHMEVMES